MIYDNKWEERLGKEWGMLMRPLIEMPNGPMDKLYAHLTKEVKENKKVLVPSANDRWNSYKAVDRHNLKCIILFPGHYHHELHGKMVSNGIPMDSSNTEPYVQPLQHLWNYAIESQYGFSPDVNMDQCSTEYLTEQGVMLLAACGSTTVGVKNAHESWWEPITAWVLQNIINEYYSGLPIILIGETSKYEKYINQAVHHVIKVEDIQSAVDKSRAWYHSNVHKAVNEIIEASNGKDNCIRWLPSRNWVPDSKNVPLQQWLGTSNEEVDSTLGPLPWDD